MAYTVHSFDDYFEQQEKKEDFSYGYYKETVSDFTKKIRKRPVKTQKSKTDKAVDRILENKGTPVCCDLMSDMFPEPLLRSTYTTSAKKEIIDLGYRVENLKGIGKDYRKQYFIVTGEGEE